MEMLKNIGVAVIGGVVVALLGYLLIVKENQMEIKALVDKVDELKIIEVKTQDSLNAAKLFIAAAHPDRDISNLASVIKLQILSTEEFADLAVGLRKGAVVFGKNNEVVKASHWMSELIKKHKFNEKDIYEYATIASMPARDDET